MQFCHYYKVIFPSWFLFLLMIIQICVNFQTYGISKMILIEMSHKYQKVHTSMNFHKMNLPPLYSFSEQDKECYQFQKHTVCTKSSGSPKVTNYPYFYHHQSVSSVHFEILQKYRMFSFCTDFHSSHSCEMCHLLHVYTSLGHLGYFQCLTLIDNAITNILQQFLLEIELCVIAMPRCKQRLPIFQYGGTEMHDHKQRQELWVLPPHCQHLA